jgi:hypothetical protein
VPFSEITGLYASISFLKKASASSVEKTLARCWLEEYRQQRTAYCNDVLCCLCIGLFAGLLNTRQGRLPSPVAILGQADPEKKVLVQNCIPL